jgi:hypothetical protein
MTARDSREFAAADRAQDVEVTAALLRFAELCGGLDATIRANRAGEHGYFGLVPVSALVDLLAAARPHLPVQNPADPGPSPYGQGAVAAADPAAGPDPEGAPPPPDPAQ